MMSDDDNFKMLVDRVLKCIKNENCSLENIKGAISIPGDINKFSKK